MSPFPASPTGFWLAFGFAAQALFFARFLVQWLASERAGRSVVPAAFWWLSIGGATGLLAYAMHQRDPVFIAGQAFGFLIYFRNLHLIFRCRGEVRSERKKRRRATGATVLRRCVLILGTLSFVVALGGVGLAACARRDASRMESSPWLGNQQLGDRIAATPATGEPLRFAVIGDLQAGLCSLPRIVQAIQQEVPGGFMIQTGDAAVHGYPQHFDLLLQQISRSDLSMPLLVVPGNHDVDWTNGSSALYQRHFGVSPSWFIAQDCLFILLDNSFGPFTIQQMRWLEEVLEQQAARVTHVLIFQHRKPIDWEGDGTPAQEHAYRGYLALLQRYRVGHVFTGHWHGYREEVRDGTRFVVNGCGGDVDDGNLSAPIHYSVVTVSEAGITVARKELTPAALGESFQGSFLRALCGHCGGPLLHHPWRLGTLALAFLLLAWATVARRTR